MREILIHDHNKFLIACSKVNQSNLQMTRLLAKICEELGVLGNDKFAQNKNNLHKMPKLLKNISPQKFLDLKEFTIEKEIVLVVSRIGNPIRKQTM